MKQAVELPNVRNDEWTLSRHPAGCRFAFTIVHDADSAYSERLSPLFEVFDELGFKLTVSAFTHWADWARGGAIWQRWKEAPAGKFFAARSVPLEDGAEREFYRRLAARGHEIALHSPSETSDTRQCMQDAFASFARIFGHSLTVYVEHSAPNNREALTFEGADPNSPYYCLDLLRSSNAWLWITHDYSLPGPKDERFYEIPPDQSPFDEIAAERWGTRKAFKRTGKWRRADGDGFLDSYSQQNLDALERDGGIALVYTHLNFGWLDPQTRRMRAPLVERLRYLAAKPGWFVPAGRILERARAIDGIRLSCSGSTLLIENTNAETVDQLAIHTPAGESLERNGSILRPSTSSEIAVGSIGPRQTLRFTVCTEQARPG